MLDPTLCHEGHGFVIFSVISILLFVIRWMGCKTCTPQIETLMGEISSVIFPLASLAKTLFIVTQNQGVQILDRTI